MKLFTYLIIFLPILNFAQFKIIGTVKDSNDQPLQRVKVYLDGSTYVTYTNLDVEFSFDVPYRNYQLIAKKEFFQTSYISIKSVLKSSLIC